MPVEYNNFHTCWLLYSLRTTTFLPKIPMAAATRTEFNHKYPTAYELGLWLTQSQQGLRRTGLMTCLQNLCSSSERQSLTAFTVSVGLTVLQMESEIPETLEQLKDHLLAKHTIHTCFRSDVDSTFSKIRYFRSSATPDSLPTMSSDMTCSAVDSITLDLILGLIDENRPD